MTHTDFLIVGAGSAGCMVAARLAHEFGLRVTIVEPPSVAAPRIDRERPSRWLNLLGSGDDWNLRTEPNEALSNRRLSWPRGRGLGGSNRINAMIWFPPTDHDLESLAITSGGRWTTEALTSAHESVQTLVQPQSPLWLSDASRRFIDAVKTFPDASPMVYRRINRRGRRWNPSSLLIRTPNGTGKIEIVRATVDRVVWDGDRAIGVRLVDGDTASQLLASRGVVICAGAIATPAILMRSGIGPHDELKRHAIDVRCEQSHVGNRLKDHLIMPVVFKTKSSYPFTNTPTTRDLVRWQALGTGPVGSNIAECGGLFENDQFQIHVTPTHYLSFPHKQTPPAMTIGINMTAPASQGRITLVSRDPCTAPRVESNYLQAESDISGLIDGVRLARTVALSAPLADWIETETLPGTKRQSCEALAKSIARYSQTLYHPVGTCGIGSSSDRAVDPEFAIRGVDRLWIADASVLPTLPRGNPNATVMTLAWLAAERVMQAVTTD